MNKGKTLFAQVIEFVPWKNFSRIVECHNSTKRVDAVKLGGELSCSSCHKPLFDQHPSSRIFGWSIKDLIRFVARHIWF